MLMESFKFMVEQNVFGVCARLGEKLQMPAKHIRLFFIYTSCLAIGSPAIIYLILAFWLKMKDSINGKRNTVWDF